MLVAAGPLGGHARALVAIAHLTLASSDEVDVDHPLPCERTPRRLLTDYVDNHNCYRRPDHVEYRRTRVLGPYHRRAPTGRFRVLAFVFYVRVP